MKGKPGSVLDYSRKGCTQFTRPVAAGRGQRCDRSRHDARFHGYFHVASSVHGLLRRDAFASLCDNMPTRA